jgi:hypothetical protein
MATSISKTSVSLATHGNKMGVTSYDITCPLTKLRLVAASSFFGEPQYYIEGGMKSRGGKVNNRLSDSAMQHLMDVLKGVVSLKDTVGKTSSQLIEEHIDEALAVSVEETLKIAVELRTQDNIRTTPQIILVRAANYPDVKGTTLIRDYGKKITLRADEPAVQLAYQLYRYGKTVPNRLKRLWKDVLDNTSEYHLAKYRMENRTVKTVDVVRFSHANSPAVDKLMQGSLKNDQNTWESLVSERGSNTEAWTEAVDKMGHMALLRNLRNLTEKGVNSDLYLDKLVAGVEKGRQLPFRYFTAFRELKKSSAPLKVLTAALSDNSGSAQGALTSQFGKVKVSEIGNLTALMTGMVSESGEVGVFGDRLKMVKTYGDRSVFSQLEKINTVGQGIGQGTETGIWLFWKNAIDNAVHYDNVFVYSDMQAGHGGLYTNRKYQPTGYVWERGTYVDVPLLIKEYRDKVNPDVNVFLVQTAGYSDTLIPEIYDKTYILGGWSGNVIHYAHKMNQLTKK